MSGGQSNGEDHALTQSPVFLAPNPYFLLCVGLGEVKPSLQLPIRASPKFQISFNERDSFSSRAF
jgi:hypothetical protein